MEELPPSSQRPPPAAKLSRTPSWVMLGFLLGAVFAWLLLKPAVDFKPVSAGVTPAKVSAGKAGAAPASQTGGAAGIPVPVPPKPRPPAPRQLSVVEAVFDAYGKNAVWDHNRTEVALWNADKGAFSDFYEVYREEGLYYFRSIPVLTRPLLTLPDHPEVPLVFTETEALRRERLESLRNLVPAEVVRQESVSQPQVEVPKP